MASKLSAIVRFPLNVYGRDYVVGDIHGMFSQLRSLLERVKFKPEHDRLFSVGDLVDRGPESAEALQWLDNPWFHACRGNHEQFAIDSTDRESLDFWMRYNGGQWWKKLSRGEQDSFRKAFLKLPLAMEVETRTGRVGIVHADIPPAVSWERFTELLASGHNEVTLYALFSRDRIHGSHARKPVEGQVDRIYCGHTPVRTPVQVDNVFYIDTGACYIYDGYNEACLTMVEINPNRHRTFQAYPRDQIR